MDTKGNIVPYLTLSMQTSKMGLGEDEIEILKDFKYSLEESIEYIETILSTPPKMLQNCDEIGYLYRDFVGEKYIFGWGLRTRDIRCPTNQKIYEALEILNTRYEPFGRCY